MSVIHLRITVLDTEFEFNFSPKTSARKLFLEVCKNLGIREIWYFGLCFQLGDRTKIWIDDSKKKIAAYKTWAKHLRLTVRFYPEDVTQHLIESITIKHFYIQTKKDILNDRIYCPADICMLLASYACQIKHGDYNEDIDVSAERLLPDRVVNQYNLSKQELIESIVQLWRKLAGTYRDENMLEYLKLAQDLDQFGVHYFQVRNVKGSILYLGVNPLGLNMYKAEDRLNPTILFPWSEIYKLDYKGRKFIIYPEDRKAKAFGFTVDDQLINKMIFNLGIGSNKLYMQCRQPDTFAMMQMKEDAANNKRILTAQREKLNKAKRERDLIEEKYQSRLKLLEDDMDGMQKQLRDAQNTIVQLRAELAAMERAKRTLEEKQSQLELMMRQLEDAKNMEVDERRVLEEQIRAKQNEVLEQQRLVEAKSAETARLQREMDAANERYDAFERQQAEERARVANSNSTHVDHIPQLKQTNKQLMEQLELLKDKLEKHRDASLETKEDKIHRANLKDGRDKYRTLNEIRRGNTTRRVDMFENI